MDLAAATLTVTALTPEAAARMAVPLRVVCVAGAGGWVNPDTIAQGVYIDDIETDPMVGAVLQIDMLMDITGSVDGCRVSKASRSGDEFLEPVLAFSSFTEPPPPPPPPPPADGPLGDRQAAVARALNALQASRVRRGQFRSARVVAKRIRKATIAARVVRRRGQVTRRDVVHVIASKTGRGRGVLLMVVPHHGGTPVVVRVDRNGRRHIRR